MDLLRLTASELQHQGSSLKGISGIQGGTDVYDVQVRAGVQLSHCTDRWAEAIISFMNPPPTEPLSWQVDAISETPSTLLTLFALP